MNDEPDRWLQRDWPDGSVLFDCWSGDTHWLPASPAHADPQTDA